MKTKKIGNLEWQADVPDQKFTWEEAKAYAASLGDGWRLPTVQELVSLWDYDQGKCSAFNGYRGVLWSSSPRDDGLAWYVRFVGGGVGYNCRSLELGVRCVRWAGDVSTDRQIDAPRSRYAAELRALADRIERGEA